MKRFAAETLGDADVRKLEELSRLCKGDILTMTSLANSGHPGGSMSSLDIFLAVYSYANISPASADDPGRDRIVVSHGHTSPGVFAALGRLGYVDLQAAVATFRLSGSLFEGHVVRSVPGCEWGTGNLGQGLSAACGFALAAKMFKRDSYAFALMSDGEQTKGQIAEARRFAMKYGLDNLTVVIDYNKIQISGRTDDVMPCNVQTNYLGDCWEVVEVDGHDFRKLYEALRASVLSPKPVCIVAHTVLGKGVSFMEHKHPYHGKALPPAEYEAAMKELGLEPVLEQYRELRKKRWTFPARTFSWKPSLRPGTPIVYPKDEKNDNRTAYGKALADIAKANAGGEYPVVVLDCDLATSVKTDIFAKAFPERFYQVGVQEHNAATVAGTLSTDTAVVFFSDFGVFGVDETFNQHRLNDQNHANVRLVCTHVGLDVGEDGKTHQCIDYVGALRNFFGFRIVVPADSNQTDRVIRAIAGEPGSWFVGMGRSKMPMILDEKGEIFFGPDYRFEYGKADILRRGNMGFILTMGCLTPRMVKVADDLCKTGLDVGVINVSCPTALDTEALAAAMATGFIVTVEDHHADTGLGATVALHLASAGYRGKFFRRGVTEYGSSGEPDFLFEQQGIGVESMKRFLKEKLA